MRKITWGELSNVLDLHKKWLEGKPGGVRANLSNVDLRFADLRNANLSNANLSCADLVGVNLRHTNLSYTNLRYANLSYTNLSFSDLSYSSLKNTNLNHADLRGTKLGGADLIGAILCGNETNEITSFFDLQCPEEGSFIGYKKADGKIVVLQITEDSKRSSATTRKCRCSKAKVLRIEDTEGNILDVKSVRSNYDENFVYTVGGIVEVKDFDNDRWNECSTGIHFFMTKQEAVNHN